MIVGLDIKINSLSLYTVLESMYMFFFISINFGRFYPALMLIFVSISILLMLSWCLFLDPILPNSILLMLIDQFYPALMLSWCLFLDPIPSCLMLITVKKLMLIKKTCIGINLIRFCLFLSVNLYSTWLKSVKTWSFLWEFIF